MSDSKNKKCPTCGSRRMKQVRQDVEIAVGGVHFVAPDVEFDQCPNCGEQIFDLAAMEKIESARQSAGHTKVRRRKIA